jgi:hypothetical protein
MDGSVESMTMPKIEGRESDFAVGAEGRWALTIKCTLEERLNFDMISLPCPKQQPSKSRCCWDAERWEKGGRIGAGSSGATVESGIMRG